jgi:hypothetical protein
MNARESGRRRTTIATTLVTVGSLVGLGIAFSTVAATIPALAGSGTSSDNGTVGQDDGGLGGGFGSPHVRSGGS